MIFGRFFEKVKKEGEDSAQESKVRESRGGKETYSTPEEKTLSEGELEKQQTLLGGCGGAEFVKVKGDGAGVLKTNEGFTERWFRKYSSPEEGRAQLAKNERAAYLVNLFLGFDFVPPTVIRSVKGKTASLQQFVENAKTYSEHLDEFHANPDSQHFPGYDRENEKLRFFDYLINNYDRHCGNYLVQGSKLIAIDHGLTFDDGDRSGWSGEKGTDLIPSEVRSAVERITTDEAQQKVFIGLLSELISENAVKDLMERIKNAHEYFSKKQS